MVNTKTCPACGFHIGEGEIYCCECGRLNDWGNKDPQTTLEELI